MPANQTLDAHNDLAALHFRFTAGTADPPHAALSRHFKRAIRPALVRRAGRIVIAKGLACLVVAAGSYLAALLAPITPVSRLGFACIAGVATLMFAINVSHDAAHGALALSRRAKHAFNWIGFALLGVDGRLWRLRHCGSHHCFPNVRGGDIDMDDNPLLRLSPHHTWRTWHRLQHLYAPFAYALVLLHAIFASDTRHIFGHRLGNLLTGRPTQRAVASFVGTKLVHFGLWLVVPPLFAPVGPWAVIAAYVVVTSLVSALFIALLVATHFAEETSFPPHRTTGSSPAAGHPTPSPLRSTGTPRAASRIPSPAAPTHMRLIISFRACRIRHTSPSPGSSPGVRARQA